MAFIPHLRIQASGTMGAVEEWSTGWRQTVLEANGQRVVDPGALQEAAELEMPNVVLSVSQFHSSDYVAGSNVILDRITITVIGADGRKVPGTDSVIVQAPEGGLPTPGTATPGYPPQVALCYSLGTERPRGRGAKGRWFYPGAVQVDSSTFQMPTAARGPLLSVARRLIFNLSSSNVGFGRTAPIVVASRLAGTLEPVTHVRLGRALDTVRRRRNHVNEDYAILPVEP